MKSEKRTLRRKLWIAVAATTAVIVVLAAVLLVRQHYVWTRADKEKAAVDALVKILAGQASFHKKDYYGGGHLMYANPKVGRGVPDLYEIHHADGRVTHVGLIPREVAEADSPNRTYRGYFFVSIPCDPEGQPYDPRIEFGVCAAPYPYATGQNLFAMDTGGTVYQLEYDGKPYERFPDVPPPGWIVP